MKKEVKIILHIDLNAFYATCAAIKEPYLKNKVFVVGGPGRNSKGIISTASYSARKYGIHSGMSTVEAQERYPKLLIVPSDFSFYYQKSQEFISVLEKYSQTVLQGSIDEAYIDITELAKTKHPLEIAKQIQDELLYDHQLPSSIGVSPTLFLSKMASDFKKPLGITVLRKKDVPKLLYPLGIEDMYGIGKKTYPKLQEQGINYIGDLMNPVNKDKILSVITPQSYIAYQNDLLGKSSDVVDPLRYSVPKSMSKETTFNYPINDTGVILDEIKYLFNGLIKRIKKDKMMTKTINIKFKNTDFQVVQRSLTINDYTDDEIVLFDLVSQLIEDFYDNSPIRLVGIGFSNLIYVKDYEKSYDLFNYHKIINDR